MQAGSSFNLNIDSNILSINSPIGRITNGPHKVIWKDINERWAIIAFEWDEEPGLGIRWFWDKAGHPIARGHSVWMVIPTNLSNAILNGLPLDVNFRGRIDKFLLGEINGSEL